MKHPNRPENWEEAGGNERRLWLAHVDSCRSCREDWIAQDPSRWFALLSEQAPGAGGEPAFDEERILEELTATVMESIPAASTGRWNPGRLLAAAVLAAALLLPLAVWQGRNLPAVSMLPLADVEILSTPGEASVIDLSVGNTQVVMIFDPELEI